MDPETGAPPQQGGPADDADVKRRMQGIAAFNMLSLFCTTAFICGMYANAFCDFCGREITFVPGFNITAACEEMNGTSQQTALCETLLANDSGVGFYGWYGTVPVNQKVCFTYTWFNPFINGWITPEFDTKFNSAAAMAITANVFGAVAWFTLMMSSCCMLSQERLYGMTTYFFLACLFQGLSLLIFASDICEVGFFQQYFPNYNGDFGSVIESVQCTQGTGSKLAITATVFYFLCMNVVPKAIVPQPIGGYSRWYPNSMTTGYPPQEPATAQA